MDSMSNMQELRKMILCEELRLDYNLIRGDVYNGNVDFRRWGDSDILIKFSQLEIRTVKGWFDCWSNNLTSLKGCPEKVNGYFFCNDNNLTSLKGCPEIVKGYFDCSRNKLTSLERGPKKVNGNFYSDHNEKKFERPTDCAIGGIFYQH